MHKLQSIHPKQNQNQITHESNKLCMLQTGRKKQLKIINNIKNNFNKVIGDKFDMIIRSRKLAISFCKKFFSYIYYIQLCACRSNKIKYLKIK